MQSKIYDAFEEKPEWTWNELKQRFSNQPEAPLKSEVLNMCNHVDGTGGKARYVRK